VSELVNIESTIQYDTIQYNTIQCRAILYEFLYCLKSMDVHILLFSVITRCSLVGVFNVLGKQTAFVRHGPLP